ncbi:MAG: polysaccharide deacetylase family protein [Burkholderiaceae bacterium]|nr:polysaccharide deacetylase family protein [Burkholderiaceae bacterium]
MFQRLLLIVVSFFATFLVATSLSGCATPDSRIASNSNQLKALLPIRFLLSFDDGPAPGGSTASILDDLEHNPLQPGIKAIFFLETRAEGRGGSDTGRQLMQREFADGHLLAFHTGTSGHENHRFLDPQMFEQSLADGVADIRAISGSAPALVRPPYWNYDARTFVAYRLHGLHPLLTDLSANDGKTWGFIASPRRRWALRHQLAAVRERIALGELPVVDGCIPVVVTFHDTNPYTARHMQEYLHILVDSAHELGLPLADQPFYGERGALERAALSRTVADAAEHPRLPGLWQYIW